MRYTLAQNSWFGGAPAEIELPDDWDVEYCGMQADSMPPLSRREIQQRLEAPIGCPTIAQLAKGKKEVAILFDDMSRGTPCAEIAELLTEQLRSAGIDRRHIRFICALGSHGPCDLTFFTKKLGSRIVEEYAVFNHNAFQNTTYVGKTDGGVELHINAELMACDLKIGIGSISPHPVNGFGGGAKIAAIGCAGMRTISQLHDACSRGMKEKQLTFSECVGNLAHDGMRKEIEQASKLIGLDFKIDAILNSNCEIVELTAGDPIEEYYRGVAHAIQYNFCSKRPQNLDVVIVNANVKANEAGLAFGIVSGFLKDNGTVVVVDFSRGGQVTHQYSGAAGYFIGGPGYRGMRPDFAPLKQFIFYSPNPDITSLLSFGNPEHIKAAKTWDAVLSYLHEYGAGTKAAVIADGTIMAYPMGQQLVRNPG